MMSLLRQDKGRLQYLRWFDILILTAIMFGQFIYVSNINLFTPSTFNMGSESLQSVEFSSGQNWQALRTQLFLLVLAGLYLSLRRFDRTQWKIKIDIRSIIKAIGLFIIVALAFDIYWILSSYIMPYPEIISTEASPDSPVAYSLWQTLSSVDLSLFLYSLLNGFYEEIFFLGICLSGLPKYRNWAVIYSLVIRYAFHTYQGQLTAIGIACIVGGLYYFLYQRTEDKNLLPFMLAHAIGDMIGVGLLSYFL